MNLTGSTHRMTEALRLATASLTEELQGAPHWSGELSSSALSTATAVIALSSLSAGQQTPEDEARIRAGLTWLEATQNADGGWGDTIRSHSNISTTALGWAAFGAANSDAVFPIVLEGCTRWLQEACGASAPGWERPLAEAIRTRYGKDRTFSVPILTACILSGRMGANGWQEVPALPFELAALPHSFYGAMQLPVVSYALPALIAIGRVIHRHAPTRNPVVRFMRNVLWKLTAEKLETLQPENGGFLEATPLTSFVLMSLAACGEAQMQTGRLAADFLRASVRSDGSWPIDTNLATWTSTLAINALSHQPEALIGHQRQHLRRWLLAQQYRVVHPYTNAAPGGWAWTDLPGGVPDADDTAGALLALLSLGQPDAPIIEAGLLGVRWLLELQNRDGGMPTFCRGWGTLPFDRSGADLTAHALRAWVAWIPFADKRLERELLVATKKGLCFLREQQREDGTWTPLWFGNQHAREEENLTWGTARVLGALRDLQRKGYAVDEEMIRRGEVALVGMQQRDGSWSGGWGEGLPGSVEETGVAVEALAGGAQTGALEAGVQWLVSRVEDGTWRKASPVGFYFAKLWYYEKLYPELTIVGALGAALSLNRIQKSLRSAD